MNKKRIILLLAMFYLFIPRVYALSVGGSSNGENYDGIMSNGASQAFIVKSGGKHTVAITYDESDSDVSNIEISVVKSDNVSVSSLSSSLGSGDTMTGSGNNYVVTTPSGESGTALLVFNFPVVEGMVESNVSVTAKSYLETGAVKETKTVAIHYYILARLTNYDNNSKYNITTNAGKPQDAGMGYTLSTTNDKISITIIPESQKSQVAYFGNSISSDIDPVVITDGALNNQSLNYGENDFIFMVTTECSRKSDEIKSNTSGVTLIGTIDWYESCFCTPALVALTVTRNDGRSTVNTLKTLSISDVNIAFKPDTREYTATVPNKVSSVKITSTLTDSKSSYVESFGNRTVKLEEGENEVLIKIKAENGVEGQYTIKITREKNNDGTLKSLKVNDKEVKLSKDTILYSVYVDNDVTKAEIKAEATDSKAKVEISELKELNEGINKVTITVTSEAGKKSIYTLNIIRDKKISENANLKNIIIENHDINFSSNKFEYDVALNKKEKELDITVITENSKANYEITGNENLKDGSVITIKVTAEDKKTVKTYKINVTKEPGVNIILIIISAALLIIGGLGAFLIVKSKKGKKVTATNAAEGSNNDSTLDQNSIPINATANPIAPINNTGYTQQPSNDVPINNQYYNNNQQ